MRSSVSLFASTITSAVDVELADEEDADDGRDRSDAGVMDVMDIAIDIGMGGMRANRAGGSAIAAEAASMPRCCSISDIAIDDADDGRTDGVSSNDGSPMNGVLGCNNSPAAPTGETGGGVT